MKTRDIKDVSAEPLHCQVLVTGGGAAGLPAALAAAEKGASVILLEKRKAAGGNFSLGGGIFAAESPLQKERGDYCRKDQLFKIAMEHCHYKVDPMIVRAVTNKSGDTIQWLMGKGVKFSNLGARTKGTDAGDMPASMSHRFPSVMHCPEGNGPGAVKKLVQQCKALGVRMLMGTAAKRILTDKTGRVAGVTAATKEKEFRIAAQSVIIATGGYAGNKDMLKKYYPFYTEELFSIGLPHAGDGLKMGMEIGAANDGLGMLMLHGPDFKAPFSSDIAAVAKEPNTVWVNKMGERFADEGVAYNWAESANALNRQPGKISFTLFDERIKTSFINDGLVKGYRQPPGTKMTGLEKDIQSFAAQGTTKISNSWDDLSHWIGAPPTMLKRTIDEYNAFCDKGYDAAFIKTPELLMPLRTPPYYALKCCQAFLATMGGIKINHRMEVLDQQAETIPGLFAVGNDAGGWSSDTYRLVLSGSALGFAFNAGRIAGENAAAFTTKRA